MSRGKLGILACDSGREFAKRICKSICNKDKNSSIELINSEEIVFPNSEIKTVLKESVRGNDVYVVQCLDDPLVRDHPDPKKRKSVNDNLLALATALEAAYGSDAMYVTAVIPQFPYSRQERRKEREPISAWIASQLLELSGAGRVITLDVHSEAIAGFFNRTRFENIHASGEIIEYFIKEIYKKSIKDNLVVVAPDAGSADRARAYCKRMGADFAILDKERSAPAIVKSMRLVGNVKGKDVLVPDDIISTAGTSIKAIETLKENGARDVYLACSLPFFNKDYRGDAIERFSKAYKDGLLSCVIGTDAVFHGEKFIEEHKWYKEVSIARLFGEVIYNINNNLSVSKLLEPDLVIVQN